MTALEEIRVKLDGAQSDLQRLEADFRKVVELKEGLYTADTSLKRSAASLSDMTSAMERSTQSMKDCISSLQSATALLAKFDPLEIGKKQDHFDQELGRMKQEIGLIVRETGKLPRKIEETVSEAWAKTSRGSGSTVFLILLVLASLVVSGANLYLTHGVPF